MEMIVYCIKYMEYGTNVINRFSGVIVSMLDSRAVDHGFEP
jgi:hypothetical protein